MSLFGIAILISHDRPRYVLPEEVIPGVPWPPGFRDEINAWSASYLGTRNMLKPGEMWVNERGRSVWVRPEDYDKMMRQLSTGRTPEPYREPSWRGQRYSGV